MFDVFLYIGLRRGDAARFGKQHVRNGVAHLMTEKSGGRMPIYVPVHPALSTSISACPSSGLAIIAKDDGTHYSKEGLGNAFRDAVAAAGIPVSKKGSVEKGYSAHALAQGVRDHCGRVRCNRIRTKRDVRLEWLSNGAALHQESRPQGLAARALANGCDPHPTMWWWGKANSYICASKKSEPGTAVVTTFGAVVISGSKINDINPDAALWWARQDSNLQPDRYERSGRIIGLRAFFLGPIGWPGSAARPYLISCGRKPYQLGLA
ncbi:hypothetical protein [Bradyrhizobium liaoningense]|uniref:hypothetical protein n=1 Tax=Bradyrhizobium liaoningense TaxID=43992 RepID=UPI001BA9C911|nr:hypothetical protein [Bradyrhizobium liaoningense]MBR1033209.1 hypothetical protein [Bradyrhizobium liaoningense]